MPNTGGLTVNCYPKRFGGFSRFFRVPSLLVIYCLLWEKSNIRISRFSLSGVFQWKVRPVRQTVGGGSETKLTNTYSSTAVPFQWRYFISSNNILWICWWTVQSSHYTRLLSYHCRLKFVLMFAFCSVGITAAGCGESVSCYSHWCVFSPDDALNQCCQWKITIPDITATAFAWDISICGVNCWPRRLAMLWHRSLWQ